MILIDRISTLYECQLFGLHTHLNSWFPLKFMIHKKVTITNRCCCYYYLSVYKAAHSTRLWPWARVMTLSSGSDTGHMCWDLVSDYTGTVPRLHRSWLCTWVLKTMHCQDPHFFKCFWKNNDYCSTLLYSHSHHVDHLCLLFLQMFVTIL